ncbi:MAG: hypothetical protein ACOXZ4_06905 [Sphaerochaetaceae bacterium]
MVQKEVAQALSHMGLSLRMLFPDSLASISGYKGFSWHVIAQNPTLCLHAIPPANAEGDFFWESWCLLPDQTVIHKILFPQQPPNGYHDIYDAPSKDNRLPPHLLGKRWYVVIADTMLGWAVQSMLSGR